MSNEIKEQVKRKATRYLVEATAARNRATGSDKIRWDERVNYLRRVIARCR